MCFTHILDYLTHYLSHEKEDPHEWPYMVLRVAIEYRESVLACSRVFPECPNEKGGEKCRTLLI